MRISDWSSDVCSSDLLESEHVCYNAGYTNVHEMIPWRTLTGRPSLYQDHHWLRAFGEGLVTWRPPLDTKQVRQVVGKLPNGNTEILLNILNPHKTEARRGGQEGVSKCRTRWTP